MELQVNGNVNVTVELGPQTLALLTGGVLANTQPGTKKEETAKPEKKEEAPVTKTEATKTQAKPKKDEAPAFEDMDDEAKLEELKAQVTKGTKKGKSADIKFLLSNFDAGRASELATDQYDAFYDVITRYHKGEAVTDIFPGDDDNLD